MIEITKVDGVKYGHGSYVVNSMGDADPLVVVKGNEVLVTVDGDTESFWVGREADKKEYLLGLISRRLALIDWLDEREAQRRKAEEAYRERRVWELADEFGADGELTAPLREAIDRIIDREIEDKLHLTDS